MDKESGVSLYQNEKLDNANLELNDLVKQIKESLGVDEILGYDRRQRRLLLPELRATGHLGESVTDKMEKIYGARMGKILDAGATVPHGWKIE